MQIVNSNVKLANPIWHQAIPKLQSHIKIVVLFIVQNLTFAVKLFNPASFKNADFMFLELLDIPNCSRNGILTMQN